MFENFGVVAAAREEIGMSSLLNETSFAEDKDLVGVLNGGETMSDDESGAAGAEFEDGFLDGVLSFRIHAGGGVVEDKETRIHEEGACDGDTLLLPSAERNAAFADDGVVAIGEIGDEVVSLSGASTELDLVESGVGFAVGDVIGNGGAEEESFLKNDTDAGAELLEVEFADIDAINQDAAGGGVVISGDEVNESAFARTGGANESVGFAGFGAEGDVVEGGLILLVFEADVLEFDGAAAWREWFGAGFDALAGVDDFEDAFGAGAGVLDDVGELADGAHTSADGEQVENDFDEVTEENIAVMTSRPPCQRTRGRVRPKRNWATGTRVDQ